MRSMILVAVLALAGCNKSKEPPKQLKKMDYKVDIDERGRLKLALELFDQKHRLMPVVGEYTVTLSRPDGTAVCSLTRPLAKTDFTDKGSYQAKFEDASCPPDPGAEQLKVALVVKSGDAPDAPKLEREVTTPVKYIYRHLAAKTPPDPKKLPAEAPLPEPPPADGSAGSSTDKPAAGSATGSAAGSATGSAT